MKHGWQPPYNFVVFSLLLLLPLMGVAAQHATENAAPKLQAKQLAETEIPSVVDESLYFKLLRVSLPAAKTMKYAMPDGIVYQISGTQTIVTGDQTQKLHPGQGIYIDGGMPARFEASAAKPAVFLHFALVPSGKTDSEPKAKAAKIIQNYATTESLPGLKAGAYTFRLTRLTFPPQFPKNSRHYRTGAALYYVLSGTGEFTHNGKTEPKPAGSVIFEPYGLVHQWGNPQDAPTTIIVASIAPREESDVKSGTPPDGSQ